MADEEFAGEGEARYYEDEYPGEDWEGEGEEEEMEEGKGDGQGFLESEEAKERRRNIQQWMEKLARVKQEEFEREEAALIPLRQYLMANVIPTLTKALIEVVRIRPEDPLEFLAEFCFTHNPGNVNSSGDPAATFAANAKKA